MVGDAMARNLTKNNAHFARAVQRLPLGVASNFRYWGEDRTIYVKHGKGARIVDLDDNEYVDYRMGYGPAILGYADERVDAAARDGMSVGGVFALSTERELKVAERISKMVPAAELVRFSNSGTEAVMAGLRLARAFTGKDDYVILEGGYRRSAIRKSNPTAKACRSARRASRTSSRPTTRINWKTSSGAMRTASRAC